MTPEFFFSWFWTWWHRVCPIAHVQWWHLSLFFSSYYWGCGCLMFIAEMLLDSGKPILQTMCELKGREILHLPGLSSFPRISYWCLPGRGFRSQTFCLKNPFLFTCLPQSHQFSSAFPEIHEKSLHVRWWWWGGGRWQQLTHGSLLCAR